MRNSSQFRLATDIIHPPRKPLFVSTYPLHTVTFATGKKGMGRCARPARAKGPAMTAASRVHHRHRLRAVLAATWAIGMATMLACTRAAQVLAPISECESRISGQACTCPADASKIMRCNPQFCLRGPMLALHPRALPSTHDLPAKKTVSFELLRRTAVEQRPGREVLRPGML